MKQQQSNQNMEADVAALSAGLLPPILQLAYARGHRKIRIVLPTVPRRHFCLAHRKVRAALCEAELAAWQATGGDFLRSARPN